MLMKVTDFVPVLVFLLLSAPGCSRRETPGSGSDQHGQGTEITGSLSGGGGRSVLLEEMGAREYIPIDTVNCDPTGAFSIEFFPEQLAFYVLRYGESAYITLLMEPGESLVFSGEYSNPASYEVSGSPGSELLRDLAQEHRHTLDALGEIGRQSRELQGSPDYAALKMQLDRNFDSITSSFRQYSLRFIQENPDSPSILIALYNLYGQGLPVFSPESDFGVYQFVDSVLMSSHGDLEAVRLLHAQVNEARQIMHSNLAEGSIQKGQIAPDFVSSRPDGTELALSDLKGNYVLLEFWAGWSGPSREENTTLRRAMELFGDKNFHILQVSVDDRMDTWTEAIAEDGLEWEQVSDLKRWDGPVVNIYRVEKIPYTVIIDPAGRVVATDLYGEQLINTLENLLNK